jgi:hypothetical protein
MRQDLRVTEASQSLPFAVPGGRRRMLPAIEAVMLVILALAPLALRDMLGVVMSTQVVLYVLFGGAGAVIGTVVVEAVSFWLSNSYQDIWPIILGILLLLVIMFRPAGLISLVLGERERVGNFGRSRQEGGHGAA